jgi:hypothetical protein
MILRALSMAEADSVISHLPKVLFAFQFVPMLGLLASPHAGFTPKRVRGKKLKA